MKEKLKKVVVITGASSGIGLKTATYLYDQGYIVYGLSRRLVEDIGIRNISCDITKKEDVVAAFKQIIELEGQIDYVVNNAGMGISGAIEYTSEQEMRQIQEVNVWGLISVCQVALPYLRTSKGMIVNIGSVAGELTIPFQSFYSMTKASVGVLTEALRMECRPFRVRVVCVLPGDTKTDFTKNRVQPKIQQDEIYQDRIIRSIQKMEKDEKNGVNPLKVSKTITRMMKRKHPPVKVVVGWDYKILVFLKRFLPNRLINWILYQMYGK
ncbi:MAG: SDR family oxidoreductase [Bacilli bacterium]|jgi:short-subunit dehydrogenase|nr:SDR family oxidoreductase [Bacilli bacterium]